MNTSRLGRSLVPVVALAALLSGCGGGVTDGELSAGVAARVGDDSISQEQVNRATEGICASLEKQFSEQGQVVPLKQMKQYAVSLMTARVQAEQIADEYGVTPGPEVATDRLEWEKTAATLPEDVREDYVDAMSTERLLLSVVTQAGEVALEREGVRKPTQEQVMARGSDIFENWAGVRGLDVDPRYAMVLTEGSLQPGETGVSVAVSDVAREGVLQATEPDEGDPEAAAALPESQRCG